ncbi:energy-coupling factor ABC transporter ATP-binding protein [Rarobacter incanus]|uniref:Biotin transport system ATP-binding protein n=1 Tax=Rarobacter incanus TaxID=153494 RepID=A0A542SMG5_9MICO|nr:ABC transporter ATP-binding protein [Rarobacter incanus]TQK75823.1 biotin transport system ATP-binding protein [Rarobacter incanus]
MSLSDPPGGGITFDGVSVWTQDAAGNRVTPILADVSLSLTAARVAIIGANGSGKTTLAKLVAALVLPNLGRVRVNGVDTTVSAREVIRQVGYLFSDPDAQIIMPTPLEDIALTLRYRGVGRKERDRRALEILDEFRLADHAHQPVQTLSGGQRQLLALAGVLAAEPAVLVCDEPTTRLDLRWRHTIVERLSALPQQVVLVTHDLEAAAACPQGAVIADGRLIATGSGRDCVERYRDLIAAQLAGGSVPEGKP